MSQPTKSTLSQERQCLIELMQRLNFGRINHITIRNGEPHLTPSTIIEREIKIGGQNGPRPELNAGDFILKQELISFFQELVAIGNGIVCQLDVKHGLPFMMRIQEPAIR